MYKFSVLFLITLECWLARWLLGFCNWHHSLKIVKHVTGDCCILIAGPLCLSTLQVYGAVAWSTDTASSGAGCLPGSGVVPQTLRAWSAAGTQGNWHLLPCLGALLWSSRDSSPHLAAAQYTKVVTLRTRTWEPSGQREFPSQLLTQSSLLLSDKDSPSFTNGCFILVFHIRK